MSCFSRYDRVTTRPSKSTSALKRTLLSPKSVAFTSWMALDTATSYSQDCEKANCGAVCVAPLPTSQLGHSPGTLSASAHVPPVWSGLTGPLCWCR